MSELAKEVCSAVDLIVQKRIDGLKFDKTIQGRILSCSNAGLGEYKVQYQDSTLTVYSKNPDIHYADGAMVYVLVPSNDFSQRKTIAGNVSPLLVENTIFSNLDISLTSTFVKNSADGTIPVDSNGAPTGAMNGHLYMSPGHLYVPSSIGQIEFDVPPADLVPSPATGTVYYIMASITQTPPIDGSIPIEPASIFSVAGLTAYDNLINSETTTLKYKKLGVWVTNASGIGTLATSFGITKISGDEIVTGTVRADLINVGGGVENYMSGSALLAQVQSGETITISGEQIFKSINGGTSYSPANITLTATLTGNLTNYQWQYNNAGTYVDLASPDVATKTFASNSAYFNASGYLPLRCFGKTAGGATGAVDYYELVKIADGSAGINGSRTAILDMYQWAYAIPTVFPAGNSTWYWSGASAMTFIPPADAGSWSINSGTGVAGQFLWEISKAYSDNLTASAVTVSWSGCSASCRMIGGVGVSGSNGASGINGTRTAPLEMYQWLASGSPAPLSPSGVTKWLWNTGEFIVPAYVGNWVNPPSGMTKGSELWIARCLYSDSGISATSTFNWQDYPHWVSKVGYSGTDGSGGAQGPTGTRYGFESLYKWYPTASGTPVAVDCSGNYNWTTGLVTNVDARASGSGWYTANKSGSATQGYTLWSMDTTIIDISGTAVNSTIYWGSGSPSGSAKIYPIGIAGENGRRATPIKAYKWSANTPTGSYTWASGITIYNWLTDTVTLPSDAAVSGWYSNPQGAGAQGDTLWAITTIVSDTSVAATSTTSWNLATTTPYVYGYRGTDGKNISITADSYSFKKAKDGTVSPDAILFSINKSNTAATINWHTNPTTSFYTTPTGSTPAGTTFASGYLQKASFLAAGSSIVITASGIDGGLLIDRCTINLLNEGSDALNYSFTNPQFTVSADAAGVAIVSQLVNSSGTLIVYEGATPLKYMTTGFTVPGSAGVGEFMISAPTFNPASGASGSPILTAASATSIKLEPWSRFSQFGVESASATILGSVNAQYIITAKRANGSTGNLYFNQLGVKDFPPKPGIRSHLDNSTHTLPATVSGVVTSYANSGTNIWVYEGSKTLKYDGIGSATGTWKAVATGSGISCTGTPWIWGSNIDADNPAGSAWLTIPSATGMPDASGTAYVLYTITGKTTYGDPFTLTEMQTFNKSVPAIGPAGRSAITIKSVGTFDIHLESDPPTADLVGGSGGRDLWPIGVQENDLWIVTNFPYKGMASGNATEQYVSNPLVADQPLGGGIATYVYTVANGWINAAEASESLFPGRTTINGGLISTDTLHARSISAGTITSDRLAARTIEVDRMVPGFGSGIVLDGNVTIETHANAIAANASSLSEYQTNISFTPQGIILGRVSTEALPITVLIEPSRIGFYPKAAVSIPNEDGIPVINTDMYLAYFDDDELKVASMKSEQELKIRNFGFKPRSNGNISFLKMG